MTKYVSDARARMQEIRPAYVLWNQPEFIAWREEIEAELAKLDAAGIVIPVGPVGNDSQLNALKAIGIAPPSNAEESMRIYLALKSVVVFWRRKLQQLKLQSDEHLKLEKQIQNAGRANVDTARRNVVG